MTTMDRTSVSAVLDVIDARRRLRCRGSIFSCEPKYRVLRIISSVKRVKLFVHPGLHRLMSRYWQATRTHSSWSRA